ncbi:MAG: zf-HC2 domain-containing protein [Actinomycetota bacterium]|nr:zf-HC2 domain-containing protein [Actinomycetota bacterium]
MSDPTTGAHPDIERLSDLEAGLLDGDPAADRLQAHVAGCASCTDLVGLLRDTQGMLADLPPIEMPADVAGRIDTALASAAEAANPATAGVTLLADRADHHRRQQGRRWLPGAGAVAAGVALLFAGAVGLSAVQNDSGGSAGKSSTAAGAAPGVPVARVPVASGQDYTPTTLNTGVRRLLAGHIAPLEGVAASGPSGSSARSADKAVGLPPDPAFDRLGRPGALTGCVVELAGSPTVRPLAIDFARFQGKPAVVVVLPDIDPAKVDAWVVGTACRPGQSDLLRFQVVPRVG